MVRILYILPILIAMAEITAYSIFLQEKTYSIASYNLQNFWDSNSDNTPEEWEKYLQRLPEKERKNLQNIQYQDYSVKKSNWYYSYVIKSKIDKVIEVLKLCNVPDIVAFQEIESANNKSKVFESRYDDKHTFKTKLQELGYKYFLLGPQDPYNPVSVTTAFISKIEITNKSPIIIEFSPHNGSARDIQVAELRLPRERVLLFNNHWKSKRGASSSIIREEIAIELKYRIEFERKNKVQTHVIILGDLNSSYFESPLKKLGTTGNERLMLHQQSPLLYNLWFELPQSSRWEHSFDGTRQTLSHILISDSLYQNQGFRYLNQSFKVIGQNFPENQILLSPDGQPFRWQIQRYYSFAYHIGKGYSDHLPLVAKFRYNKKGRGQADKQRIENPSNGEITRPTYKILNNFKNCHNDEYENITKIKNNIRHLINKCVKIEIPEIKQALKFSFRGKYRSNYITIPAKKYNFKINITMANPYNWRNPEQQANEDEGFYNSKNPHPQSNKCFNLKVLQGKGGELRAAKGRLGYVDGFLSLIVNERKDISLESLPSKKRTACQ
jgi:exonuclease III